ADVLNQKFRPAGPARLGIEYETLRADNPRLIYCALPGYGERGPRRDNAGFDQVLQSMTGIAAFQGGDGPPQVVVGSIVDYYASSLIAYGVAAALYRRQVSGEGQRISVSLLRTAIAMQAGRFVWAESEPREVNREMRPGRTAGIHPTRSGYLYISAHSARFWESLCECLGVPELARDPRYDDMRKRAEHADELLPIMHRALATRTAAEWERLMHGKVPCAHVREIEDMFDDPQVLAEGLVTTLRHPTVGAYRTMTKPIVFSKSPGPPNQPAPLLGEHTDAVLAELGYPPERIAELRRSGSVA
ncbi:MAG: CaiB/BaiF CoA transferase family protein, partial [Lautropia sp.]